MSDTNLKSLLFAVVSVILAMVCIQSGASIAKQLFPVIGPEGTTALRVGFSALILWLVFRPWRHWPQGRQWRALTIYGACLGGMNILFYLAIERIPLGVGVALEFTGPLAVALLMSRRKMDLAWVACALAGVLMLMPDMRGEDALDPIGVLLALAAGGCWAGYILFGQKAGHIAPGGATVALGMTIAALYLFPIGLVSAGTDMFQWQILPLALMIAVMSSALPYSLEMVALKRLPPKNFSVLMSVEPAVAAVAGLLILSELLTVWQWLAIALVITASLGSSLTKAASPSAREVQTE